MRRFLCLLCLAGLLQCCSPHQHSSSEPEQKGAGKEAAPTQKDVRKSYQPALPVFFGLSFFAHPRQWLMKLNDLGCTVDSWTLEPPYSKCRFSGEGTLFSGIDLYLCNRPSVLARITMAAKKAGSRDSLVPLLLERFALTYRDLINDEKNEKTYKKAYADSIVLTLTVRRSDILLDIQSTDFSKNCAEELKNDLTLLQKERESQANEQTRKARSVF